MPPKPDRKKKAAKKLTALLDEHLSRFTSAQQSAMHDRFEKRLATRRDSEAKTPSRSPAEAR